MVVASLRMRRLAEGVLDELELVLDMWADQIDRRAPLSAHSVASIDALLAAARRVASREAGVGLLLVLPRTATVLPADAVIRLLAAQHLLLAFVRRHGSLSEAGEIAWHEGAD
ncbi:MAG: hypothetical protein P4M09_24165 [Devosia sp.]|nr:hypothetical protein [Devosia sp.]